MGDPNESPLFDHLRLIFLESYNLLFVSVNVTINVRWRHHLKKLHWIFVSVHFCCYCYSNDILHDFLTWLSYGRNESTEISGSNFCPFSSLPSLHIFPSKRGSTEIQTLLLPSQQMWRANPQGHGALHQKCFLKLVESNIPNLVFILWYNPAINQLTLLWAGWVVLS